MPDSPGASLGPARADSGADAVHALAQLTDPARLALLSDAAFAAQLGPALGWLHVARRRDISPEAVLARAFQASGLDPARAQRNRECLLRNLARADGWALFQSPVSAQALALGQPAVIQTGPRRGRLAGAAFRPTATGAREFADLVLRADDEPLPRRMSPRGADTRRRGKTARLDPVPTEYDDSLPVR